VWATRSIAPIYLKQSNICFAQSFNKFISTTSRRKFAYLHDERISDLVSNQTAPVTTSRCSESLVHFFFNSYYYQHILLNMYKKNTKIIHIITCILIHSSFCVLKFTFPACRSNSATDVRTKWNVERVCLSTISGPTVPGFTMYGFYIFTFIYLFTDKSKSVSLQKQCRYSFHDSRWSLKCIIDTSVSYCDNTIWIN